MASAQSATYPMENIRRTILQSDQSNHLGQKRSIVSTVLDIISKRAPPRQWANYSSASTAMWPFNPSDTRLATDLRKSAYINDRRPTCAAKFCDTELADKPREKGLNHINSVDFDWIKDNAF